MNRVMHFSLGTLLALGALTTWAQSQVNVATANPGSKFLALVIGNSNYAHNSKLAGVGNDARDMAQLLGGMGFEISNKNKLEDLSREEMAGEIARFLAKLDASTIAVVYYSGHGLEDSNENFLVPVDAKLESPADVQARLVSLNELLTRMDRRSTRTKVVILDACRNMPEVLKHKSLGSEGGLGEIKFLGAGTKLIYAAAIGQKAVPARGNERNSLFTSALLRAANEPFSTFDEVVNRAGEITATETNRAQTPWASGNLGMSFRLRPVSPYVPSSIPAPSSVVKDVAIATLPKNTTTTQVANADGRKGLVLLSPGLEELKYSGTFASSRGGDIQAGSIRARDRADNAVLLAKSGARPVTLAEPTNGMTKLQFNSAGNLLLGQQYSSPCYLWRSDSGALLAKLEGSGCTFLPGAEQVLMGHGFGGVSIYDIESRQLTSLDPTKKHYVRNTSSDGKYFFTTASNEQGKKTAMGFQEDDVWIWSLATKRPLKRMRGHTHTVLAVTSSGQAGLIATGSYDKLIRLWSYPGGDPVRELRGHSDGVSVLAFSPDGKYLASGGWDKKLFIWEAATGKELYVGRISDHDRNLSFSPDSRFLVFGSGYDATNNNHAFSVLKLDTLEVKSLQGYLAIPPVFDTGTNTFITRAGKFAIDW